jgi:xanthine permease XanP
LGTLSRPRWLDLLLPPFTEPAGIKPRDMLYVAHEVPPRSMAVALAVQHVALALMLIVYLVVTGTACGLSDAALRNFVSLGIAIMGIGTLVNALRTRISAGHLMVRVPSTVAMASFITSSQSHGLAAAAGATLAAGVVIFLLGRYMTHLRRLFPPEVNGVLLILLGISLVPEALRRTTALVPGVPNIDTGSVTVAMVTLGVIVSISIWAGQRVRMLALFFGAGAGLATAWIGGQLASDAWSTLSSQPWAALPWAGHDWPVPVFTWAVVAPMVLVGLVSVTDTLGQGITLDRMSHQRWSRPDMALLARLVHGHGLSWILCGLAGTLGTATSSAHVGLSHATGVTARIVGLLTGGMLIALAFLPMIATAVILLPVAVVGAIMLYTASFMMVQGAELVLTRLLNNRRRSTVGLGLAAGMALIVSPELRVALEVELGPIMGSPLLVGMMTALLLNLVFHIGTTRTAELVLDGRRPAEQAARFLEEHGMDWGMRRDIVTRAASAIGEALEVLHESGVLRTSAALRMSFDEYILAITLEYTGRTLVLDAEGPIDWQALINSEDGIDQATSDLPAQLINQLADQVDFSEHQGRARLLLNFDH